MSYQQALQAIQSGQFEAAIEQLTRLLQVDPAQPKLWQAKALAWLSLERPEAAIADVEQALRLNPQMAPAHRLLGNAYRKLGNTQAAIAAYKQAAQCYIDQQDKANARDCLTQIDQLRPPVAAANSFLAETAAQVRQGQYRQALENLDWLLQFEPNNSEALALRSLLQLQCRNPEAAVTDLARAMQLAPDNPALQLQRGEMRLRLGDAHGAIADFTALLNQRQGDLAQLYTLRGLAYQQIRDADRAFKDFSNALGIDPRNAACYKSQGQVYESMGDLSEAMTNYRQAAALHLDQGNWSGHQELQQLIRELEAKLHQKEVATRIVRVPIKYWIGQVPVIEVVCHDSYRFDMLLDPAANVTCLTQQMAQVLNLVPAGWKRFFLADGQMVEAAVGYVRSLAAGQFQVSNLEVAIISSGQEGLLGQNYLGRYHVQIFRTEVELSLRQD